MEKSLDITLTDTQKKLTGIKALLFDYADKYGVQLVEAILVLICGFIITRAIANWAKRALDKKDIEPPVKNLILRLIKLLLFVVTFMVMAETVGFKITSLFVGLSVAGVGLGLAMQGVLSNMVAGLTIIFTKPFKVGEYIEMIGVSGEVRHIDLTSSRLLRNDLSVVILPNRHLVGEVVHNFGTMRQAEMKVGVGYSTDVPAAIALIRKVLDNNGRVLKSPASLIGISGLGECSIELTIKSWVKLNDFGLAQPEIFQAVLDEFRAAKIEIPFPQREVRLLNQA